MVDVAVAVVDLMAMVGFLIIVSEMVTTMVVAAL